MTATTFLDGRVTLHGGDCLEILRTLPDASVDSVVTDPPYHLTSIVKRFGAEGAAPAKTRQTGAFARASRGFMGQTWDGGDIAFHEELWAEVLRVLKPGGHLAAFSGTRTYHRMAVAIEDAGFEIRDQLAWTYGSGFPKSHDVAKGIAKRRNEDAEPQRAVGAWLRSARERAGLRQKDVAALWPSTTGGLTGCVANWELGLGFPSIGQWEQLKAKIGFNDEQDAEVRRLNDRKGLRGAAWSEAEIVGEVASQAPGFGEKRFAGDGTLRQLDGDAADWQGWGTALKPAWEPICLARKPLAGTVAANVLAHGVGALNIQACEVSGGGGKPRFPANLIHDGSPEVLAAFPQAPGQSGTVTGGEPSTSDRYVFARLAGDHSPRLPRGDSGSAARFFYTAKADADDRIGSKHPTVKPVDLMQWLVRLVTPKGGVVLDLFAGTGTTGEAAWREGCQAVLIEREPVYREDIARRMSLAAAGPQERRAAIAAIKAADDHGPLFGMPVAAE